MQAALKQPNIPFVFDRQLAGRKGSSTRIPSPDMFDWDSQCCLADAFLHSVLRTYLQDAHTCTCTLLLSTYGVVYILLALHYTTLASHCQPTSQTMWGISSWLGWAGLMIQGKQNLQWSKTDINASRSNCHCSGREPGPTPERHASARGSIYIRTLLYCTFSPLSFFEILDRLYFLSCQSISVRSFYFSQLEPSQFVPNSDPSLSLSRNRREPPS